MADDREERRTQALLRLSFVEAIIAGLDAPHELLDLMLTSADPEGALVAVQEHFGLPPETAQALLDVQVRRFTQLDVERLRSQRGELIDLLDQLDRESD